MPLFRSRAAEKAEDTKAKLDVARAQIRLLEHELALAEQTEAERAATARANAERSRWRAIRHEINALLKAALEFEVGYARCVSAFDRMVAAGDNAKKLLRLTSREEQWLGAFLGLACVDVVVEEQLVGSVREQHGNLTGPG